MIQSGKDAERFLQEGQPIMGRGWKEVDTFEDLDDIDEYESDDEEIYVVMDLGQAVEGKTLLAETSYQLIGLDTPMPFLKLGNQVFQGQVSDLIGDEIVFGRIRNEEKPQAPSRPPWHSTSHRLTFRPVTLRPRVEASSSASTKKQRKQRATATSATEPVHPVDVKGTEVGAEQESVRGESDNVAGPSQPRQSGSPDRADAPLAGAHLTHSSRKPLKKVPINTMEQLLAIDLETVAPQIRFSLSAELEAQLQPITTPDHLLEIAERGYSPAELDRVIYKRPLRGKGSRVARKGKGREITALAQEEEDETSQQEGQVDVTASVEDNMGPKRRGRRKSGVEAETMGSQQSIQETFNGLILETKMADASANPRSKRGRAVAAAGLREQGKTRSAGVNAVIGADGMAVEATETAAGEGSRLERRDLDGEPEAGETIAAGTVSQRLTGEASSLPSHDDVDMEE